MASRQGRRPAPVAPTRPLDASVTGAGPVAVVLLHGQPGSRADWQWVVPLLSPDHTVVVPDRPGYGRTGGPATGFGGNADAVISLLDRLGRDRAVIVGHSWAGGAALAAAISRPERVLGLVLVSSVGPGEPFHWDDRLLAAPYLGEAMAAVVIGGASRLVASRPVRDLADRRLSGRARDGFTTLDRLTRDHAPVWRSFVVEQRALLGELSGLGPGLATIDAPTAVLHGSHDRFVPVSVARSLSEAIAGADLTVIEGVGHMLPHDRPSEIAAAVRRVAGAGPTGIG